MDLYTPIYTPIKQCTENVTCNTLKIQYGSVSILGVTDPQISNITRWHGHLMSQDIFCKSESEVTGNKGISAFMVILV